MFSFIKRLLLIAALCVPWVTQAQELSTYSVTTSTTTYTSIANADSLLSSVDGDAGTQTVALPFNFDFGETTYLAGTNLTVRADGYIYFGSSSPGHSSKSAWTSTTNYSLIAPLITYDGKITANGATSGAYKALLSDDNGDAMLVIEFKGVQCYYTDYGSYNYQIRLHSNGNISAVYGSNTPTTNSSMVHNFFLINGASDKVCLTGSFASPVMGSPSALPNLSTMPANGAVITYNRPVISCPRPIFTFSNITNGSIDFSITPGGTETEWLYRLNGGSWESVTTTTSTISSLSSGTLYDVDYVAYCGADDTSFAGSYTFRTMCDAILNSDLPYTYDFEDATGSGAAQSIDSCWRRYTNYTTAYPYPSTSYHHSGTKSLYFYSTSTYYSYVTLPPFDDDIEDLFLSFWAYKTSANYGHIYIGVMSDPADITTFDTIASGQVSANSLWELVEVTLSNYTGDGQYLAILCPKGTGTNYTYIDDITVDFLPPCPTPTD
ncbi:MAG: hypothetical protein II661_08180, partial [Bacteroidales bacterium]|nr:hypothetical protein [Bacteroidales bacterium]